MRVLVNVFHPNLEGSRVGGAWARAAESGGCEVRDLYRLYPDFRIDVEAEQALAEGADRIVFQHPLHWYAPPALMKKWMEDVLTFGWAYGGPDRLAGKEWLCAVTVGARVEEYGPDGSRGHTMQEFLRPIERTAHFCRLVW
ncbi:MAG TPA: NAD(P)H-dependent oxidoreductase, partial [Roseimicrobium sp.]|nr:NAD(P)H-dependent oxidoreductase [Roseimicrobium sp.]